MTTRAEGIFPQFYSVKIEVLGNRETDSVDFYYTGEPLEVHTYNLRQTTDSPTNPTARHETWFPDPERPLPPALRADITLYPSSIPRIPSHSRLRSPLRRVPYSVSDLFTVVTDVSLPVRPLCFVPVSSAHSIQQDGCVTFDPHQFGYRLPQQALNVKGPARNRGVP